MKPTLFLLAAGMGSRYGGLKQLDGLGPNGETIMDYSIYDAIKAGFGKLVFVIRKDFEQDFRDKIISKYEGHIPCELVFQELDALPEGFTCPADRTKPWGTNHAVMMGADVIKEPFAVINCDDFYGRDSFQVMGKFLSELPEGSKNVYSMVGFRIGNTLSESGTVSRGLCSTDANNLLTSVVERTKIQRMDGEVKYIDDNGEWTATADTTPVSMNFWGFTPDYFAYSQEFFKTFLSDSKNMENLKSEFFIPLMVDKLINDGTATVEVLDTNSKWFGVTYKEDKELEKRINFTSKNLKERIRPLVEYIKYEIFDNVENVIVFYDEQPSDNLNGELWHKDLVCKADLDAGVIYSFGRITRIYRNGAWEYTTYDNNGKETAYSDKSEAIKAVLSENQSKKVYLRKQTDKLKNELQSNIWTIQNYTTEASYDEEYLSGALYFSNDGTCFYWNSPEIKNSFNYEINGNTLSLSNGETYTIIENAEDDSHCLAASNGCAYMAEQNYSISEL